MRLVEFCSRAAALAALGVGLVFATRVHAQQAFSAAKDETAHFTAEQAARGQAAYASSCVMCHGEGLGGSAAGPPLVGPVFGARWRTLDPTVLFFLLQDQMPLNAPGSLDKQTYTDLTAYIFKANGIEAGDVAYEPLTRGFLQHLPSWFLMPLRTVGRAHTDPGVEARRQADLEKLTPVTDEMLRNPSAADWLIWRHNYGAQAFSPLTQINKQDVRDLGVAWSRSLPISGNETTPLVHDGVLFIKSANHVEALDGATGDLLWRYVHSYPEWMDNGASEIVKTMAIYQNMLYVPFLDGMMVALDIKTGKPIWERVVVGAADTARRVLGQYSSDVQMYGMTMDGGPIVADGKIIFGFAGCANPYQGGCYILALDAKTGQEAWRFWSIARPGTPGGDSWNGAPWKERYGADSWFPGSYDPNLNIVYFGTGNTYNIQQLLRPQARKGDSNDARWTESTLALDASTGKLVWGYQHLSGDVWDLDWTFEQTLVTLPVNGVMRQLNVSAGKMGIFDALDRANGQYVFSKSLDLENIITGIDPKTGKKTINPAMRVSPDTLAYPANLCSWARDEPNTAFDPTTDILYVPVLLNSCPDKGDDPYGSRLEALNLATQKVVWIQRHYSQEMTSLLVTAGGIVFDGSDDRYFRASDSATGSLLWQTRLDSIPKSSPVTYSVDGTQYVAVVAANRAAPAAAAATSDVDSAVETLWVFKLNR